MTLKNDLFSPVLYSRFSLVVYFIYINPNFQVLSTLLPALISMFALYVFVSISVLQIGSSRFHIYAFIY